MIKQVGISKDNLALGLIEYFLYVLNYYLSNHANSYWLAFWTI